MQTQRQIAVGVMQRNDFWYNLTRSEGDSLRLEKSFSVQQKIT